MNRAQQPTPSPTHHYVTQVHRHLLRLLAARVRSHVDLDDVVQEEVVALLARIEQVMLAYPDPLVYAAVRATGRRALVGWMRKQGTQDGSGSRLGRTKVSTDAAHPGDSDDSTLLSLLPAADGDFVEHLAEHEECTRLLQQALLRLDPKQRAVLRLTDIEELTATEAGKVLGYARETVTRIRGRALAAGRDALAA